MPASILGPESECIPGPAEPARARHGLQRLDGIFAERLAGERHPQHADLVAARHRREYRRMRDQLRGEQLGLAFGHRDHQAARKAGAHRRGGPLPDGDRLHGRAGGVQPHAVVRLVAPVEQLLRFARARGIRCRAEQHGQQAPPAALGGGDETVARALREARLHAVHARVEPQQPVAIHLCDAVVGKLLQRVVARIFLRKVLDQRGR